jgi:hypothetical protein
MNHDTNREDHTDHALDALALSMGIRRQPAGEPTIEPASCLCLSCGARAQSAELLPCGH